MAFLDTLKTLPLQKKLMAAGAAIAAVIAVAFLAGTVSKPSMGLLYAGLEQGVAGEIVTRLDTEGVPYEIDGERIYVPNTERDRLRLLLAQEGLPRSSVVGYELLDDLGGFSTTSDMFSAAYWRAKEGELARTIHTMPGVQAARVHIGGGNRSVFARGREGRTASVTVTAPQGLDDAQVRAIQHLTALAVAGMNPTDVAVIDARSGLLSVDDAAGGAGATEEKRARSLEAELTRLLEARVGPGNARVSVAMELSRAREAISEQTVDPDSAIVTERTTTEARETERGGSRNVTVASDLPDGEAGTTGEERAQERNETSETVAYMVSTRERQVERLPGEVRRLTIAVLLNAPAATETTEGEDVAAAPVARPAEEIAALRELVETAAGIDPGRGDRLSIQSMAFEPMPEIEMPEVATPVTERLMPYAWDAARVAILAVVALVLGLFVVKPILTQNGTAAGESAALAELNGHTVLIDDPVTMLRAASSDEPEAAAALLNAWLDEEEAA